MDESERRVAGADHDGMVKNRGSVVVVETIGKMMSSRH